MRTSNRASDGENAKRSMAAALKKLEEGNGGLDENEGKFLRMKNCCLTFL